jgi:hypothetical protein
MPADAESSLGSDAASNAGNDEGTAQEADETDRRNRA